MTCPLVETVVVSVSAAGIAGLRSSSNTEVSLGPPAQYASSTARFTSQIRAIVVADLSATMSSWRLAEACPRESGVEDPIEPRTHQEDDIGVCNANVRATATDSGWSSGITPLPVGDRRKGIYVRSRKMRTPSSARDQAVPVPTMTRQSSIWFYLLYSA
jgi:hypothetical protein